MSLANEFIRGTRMQIQIVLNDEDVEKAFQQALEHYTRKRYRDGVWDSELQRFFMNEIEEVLRDIDWRAKLEDTINAQVDTAVQNAVTQKVNGWVKRQVKEVMKYATANFWQCEHSKID